MLFSVKCGYSFILASQCIGFFFGGGAVLFEMGTSGLSHCNGHVGGEERQRDTKREDF